ncbi:hypothetical protein ZOSMA_175G00070 [Zostera marina]|uniref:Uncharacterized protein n=1 Tax=Zostera marina TaxID=29655 RepID=A0A0K9PRS7_ZOSMR|nr:hypothetical protein ZOSMA_175G00070 [Zostera marina]
MLCCAVLLNRSHSFNYLNRERGY